MRTLLFAASLLVLAFSRIAGGATGDATAARAEIEKTLAAMSAAIIAANTKAYLAHVDDADPIFMKEQQNWVKDLERTPISSVTLSIAEEGEHRPVSFGDDRSTFELVMAWELPPPKDKPDAKPRKREVSFPAAFVRHAPSGTWRFAGENWLVLEHDGPATQEQGSNPTAPPPATNRHRARVKHLPGFEQVAKTIAEALPEVREQVDAEFGVNITRVQEVKVYPTMRHLQASIYLSYTDGLSGWNEPGEAIKLLVRPSATEKSLRPLLAHEYGHVATFELGPRATDMPWWILEGVAELMGQKYDGRDGKDAERAVTRWHASDKLADWSAISDFRNTAPKLGEHVYKQGQHMVGFVTRRAGKAGRIAWLTALAQGQSLDEATKAALGMSFAELDAAWREEIRTLSDRAKEKQKDSTAPEPAEK
ncbi:MAG: hypothetical protein K2W85_07430 [Phycisphaerales bacterium]|nr:hypothetical protein [Phycisphaerales bacterium]